MHTKIIQLQLWLTERPSAGDLVYARVPVAGRASTRGRTPVLVRTVVALGASVILSVSLLGGVAAAAVQGYNTKDTTITPGMAVAAITQTAPDGTPLTLVEKASLSQAGKTLGVSVNPSNSLVASSSGAGQVYVATTGQVQVYVADINGAVHRGDLLGPSPLTGILMRANPGSAGILGVASQNAPGDNPQSVRYATEDGQSATAQVALFPVNMDLRFANTSQAQSKSFLQRIGESIVHRQVSPAQVFAAMAILVLLIVVEGGIIYAAVSSSITAIGRNPLAKQSINRGLGQITALVVVVLAAGVAIVYLVLRV